ncbi:MAG TPA: hypothetical protein VNA17_02890 [Pyrinomonadaceae bacterium]|nr:hypothetical protein [Pyrinomonadaceae bacterium]
MCEAEEQGIVISNYPSFGYGVPNEWMAVPLLPFLHGVENEREIPLYANGKTRNFLREQYRRNHLASLIRGAARMVRCRSDNGERC